MDITWLVGGDEELRSFLEGIHENPLETLQDKWEFQCTSQGYGEFEVVVEISIN